jgi:hypothetical protein
MYESRYIQYLNLPPIPEDIILEFPKSLDKYKYKDVYTTYHWSDSYTEKLNVWAQKYICPDMYFAVQIIDGDLVVHKDVPTLTKLNCVIETGGDNVFTKFWSNNKTDLLASYKIEPFKWHILKADTFHSVDGIDAGKIRLCITGKVF